jgi:hypothetical protein
MLPYWNRPQQVEKRDVQLPLHKKLFDLFRGADSVPVVSTAEIVESASAYSLK